MSPCPSSLHPPTRQPTSPLLLLQCSREYWGTNPAGVREISRACALEDEARAAVASAVPPELQARLEELVAQGGPAPAPPSELRLALVCCWCWCWAGCVGCQVIQQARCNSY